MYLKASEQALPVLHKGDTLTVTRTNITSGKTKAPARFTEATLLSAMENPVRYMSSDDNKMKKTLGETVDSEPWRQEPISLRNYSTLFCWKRREMRFF